MQGSIYTEADTEPLVNGGSYVWETDDGSILEGLVMGVRRNPAKPGKDPRVEANLYIFDRGPVPVKVVEGTTSFAGWKLVAAPAKSAADYIKGRAKKDKAA